MLHENACRRQVYIWGDHVRIFDDQGAHTDNVKSFAFNAKSTPSKSAELPARATHLYPLSINDLKYQQEIDEKWRLRQIS